MTVEINVETVDDVAAGDFWELSPHATAFSSPRLLSALEVRVTWWLALKGSTPFLMWPIVEESDKSKVIAPPFSYYFGPMWSIEAWSKSPTSWLADAQACYGAILAEIIPRYSIIEFELNPAITDVRVFDWWNYGKSSEERFEIRPRYSAQLSDLQERDLGSVFASMRKWRRIEVRRARDSQDFEVTTDVPMDLFSKLREETLAIQGATQDPREELMIPKFEWLVKKGIAYPLGIRDKAVGDIVAANLVIDGPREANLVLSVRKESYRNTGVGPLATFEAIIGARRRGLEIFDFNGANSPQRGDDKHSYGASPALYFALSFPGGS